jgi:uncharacterized membrane protein
MDMFYKVVHVKVVVKRIITYLRINVYNVQLTARIVSILLTAFSVFQVIYIIIYAIFHVQISLIQSNNPYHVIYV